MMGRHYSEGDLTLYYYGEARKSRQIELHLESCAACHATYREIAGVLATITMPEAPERGEQYGLEVWQRIRVKVAEERESGFSRFSRFSGFSWFSGFPRGAFAAVAVLIFAVFIAGRLWNRSDHETLAGRVNGANAQNPQNRQNPPNAEDPANRILLASVAEHLDRSERMLTDIMNAPATPADGGDISAPQRWADDLLATSRLYRQDAADAGEQSVAAVLDDLERSLLEIVHSPSRISAADLEQLRRRIDAAALLFKVRVMSDDLRQREQQPARRTLPSTSQRKTS
jgi:hypothetical protein